jgi:hypothetical protein
VYQLRRPTALATTLRTFDAIRAYVGRRPGSQPPWVRLSASPSYAAQKSGSGRYDLLPTDGAHSVGDAAEFLYIDGLFTASEVRGKLVHDRSGCAGSSCGSGMCKGSSVQLALIDSLGRPRVSAGIDRPATTDGSFTVRLEADAESHLVVRLADGWSPDDGAGRCGFGLRDLAVSHQD